MGTDDLWWVKSSRSGSAENMCVEVARSGYRGILARDSKRPSGPRLCFGARAWEDFLGSAPGAGVSHCTPN
ncbi:DUF397 domain-containing protein [Streptomycetaceae bacterium NBC_01309]